MHDIDRTLSLAEMQDASDDELNEFEDGDMDKSDKVENLTKKIYEALTDSELKGAALEGAILTLIGIYFPSSIPNAFSLARLARQIANMGPLVRKKYLKSVLDRIFNRSKELEFDDEMDIEDEFEMPSDSGYGLGRKHRGRWIRRGNQIILLGV